MALRSALASLPARLRATPAATAAGGWRRLLSDDPKDGRPEDTLKAQNEKNILKEQVDKYNKEIKELKDQIERAETEKQLLKYQIQKKLLLENVLTKRELDFERKLNENRVYFQLKKRETEMMIRKTAADSNTLLKSFDRECRSHLDTMENLMVVQNNKLSILKKTEDLRIRQAHISVVKAIPWFVLTLGGGAVTVYLRVMGLF